MNDGTWTYEWKHGRELSTMTNGTITVRNAYNSEGGRIAKIVNRSNGSETHRYTYNNGKLVYDIIRINDRGTISNLTILMSYDESGRPFMITYDNVSYYYLLNAQGDVVGIMDVNGNIMVEYTYDAWGALLSISGPMKDTMGKANQLRYRGYVYDQETGLYYLNSRYYNPKTGRFINADAFISTGGLLGNNMFTYCNNNPVNLFDPSGYLPFNQFAYTCVDGGGGGGRKNIAATPSIKNDSTTLCDIVDTTTSVQQQQLDVQNKIIQEQNKLIQDGLNAVCDAYMQGYNMQQNAQLQEAQLTLDGVVMIYDFLNETDAISVGMVGFHSVQAIREGKKALAYWGAPIPTAIDEAFAFGHAAKALYHLFKSILEVST